MKKIVLFVAMLVFVYGVNAQDKNFSLKKISLGTMVTVGSTATFPFKEKPFETWLGFAPAFNLVTGKTHHHVMYGTNNSIQTLNGYFLGKNWDTYVFYSKSLNSSNMYLSAGIEKVIPVEEYQVLFVFFAEVGTNLQGTGSTSIGVVVHPQLTVWKKK